MRRHFSLRQIEGFLLAANARSFSRAAESMQISQSAFSQLINTLETSLGVRLFDRTTRSVVLTGAGEAMYRKMKRGVEMMDEAWEEARSFARIEHGHIDIGTFPSLANGIVTQVLGRLHQEFPEISVTLKEGGNNDVISRVSEGELDLAVCTYVENTPGLTFHHLFDDELLLIAPANSRFASNEILTWNDIDNESFIRVMDNTRTQQIAAAFSAHHVTLSTKYEAASLSTALSMVRAGFGLAFMSGIVKNTINLDGLVALRIEDPPHRQLGIYRKSERTPSPAARKFEEFLAAELKKSKVA